MPGEAVGAATLAVTSLGPSQPEQQLLGFAKVMADREACWALIDTPPGPAVSTVLQFLRARGWAATEDGRVCSEFGDPVAQRKVWILATKGGATPPAAWLGAPVDVPPPPLPMAGGLLNAKRIPPEGWLAAEGGAAGPRPTGSQVPAPSTQDSGTLAPEGPGGKTAGVRNGRPSANPQGAGGWPLGAPSDLRCEGAEPWGPGSRGPGGLAPPGGARVKSGMPRAPNSAVRRR